MKIIKFKTLFIVPIVLVAIITQANELEIGKKISPENVTKLSKSNVLIDSDQYAVLNSSVNPQQSNKSYNQNISNMETYVVNNQNVIGKSNNIIIISDVPTVEVKSKLSKVDLSVYQIKYYDHLDNTSLQFKTFQEAVSARNFLVQLFPNSRITIPITYSKKNTR